ncbi:hypothetical protein EI42_05850 [Thermosporothrix hazakensis]|jgi:hypothetical protein|uniref:Uncharacterized protein n=1 Tax=Thermosporothrix hazakensis TaxID=644383 RepID=A0A326TVF6_THEHA|nr:hypothetical protein EI42_05850 [Thermosporothrix hazakensis]
MSSFQFLTQLLEAPNSSGVLHAANTGLQSNHLLALHIRRCRMIQNRNPPHSEGDIKTRQTQHSCSVPAA